MRIFLFIFLMLTHINFSIKLCVIIGTNKPTAGYKTMKLKEWAEFQFYRHMCVITTGELHEYFFVKKHRAKEIYSRHKFSEEDINLLIEYEKIYPKNILSREETMSKIINERLSVARIGDGEYNVMLNQDNVWKNNSPFLKDELLKILKQGSNNKCLVCINPYNLYENTVIWFCHYWLSNIKKIAKTFEFNKENFYGDAYVFSLFFEQVFKKINLNELNASSKLNGRYLYVFDKEKLNYLKQLFNNRDIVFVTNKNSLVRSDELNIFNGCNSKSYIDIPEYSCIKEYDRIMREILKHDKKSLIYLECGEVATVLAYHLADLGYQALDVGDFYKRLIFNIQKKYNKKIKIKNKDLLEKIQPNF